MPAEAMVSWAVSGAVVAGIVVPYLRSFRRRARYDWERKEEAARLGIDRPTAQYPFVEPSLCLGCGTCAASCPEGDVLGVVGGVATVINGLKCVGHGRCAEACPVGAIEVGLGDLKSRSDIPLTDDWQETSVPGVFVAGEVAGLALVRNAVSQGRKVVERIAKKLPSGPRRTGADVFDVIVVGSGPAGLAAAAAARERGLSPLVLEQEGDLGGTIFHYPRRKLVLVQELELPLWGVLKEGEYSKERLLEILQDLSGRAGLDVRFGEKVLDVRKEGGLCSVKTAGGAHLGRSVVLAIGRRGTPRKLGVPGEELPKVSYQLKDAGSYSGQRVLIVGGGDSAAEAAIGLAQQPGNRVTLSYRRERLVRIKRKNEERIQQLIDDGRIQTRFGSQVAEILKDRVRLRVGEDAVELDNDYVFVFAGGEPPFGFLRKIGVRFGGEEEAPPRDALRPERAQRPARRWGGADEAVTGGRREVASSHRS